MSTIFEKIVKREIPAYIVYEDELAIAFLDISQATKGHTLVVPKAPYRDIFELPEDVASHLMKVIVKLAKAVQTAFNPRGLNILSNNGEVAGQSVFHYHMHIIPRYDKTDVGIHFENHMSSLEKTDYEKRANLVKAALL
ncbi:MAG: HIT family protein [Acholeplasmataceae bacterium]